MGSTKSDELVSLFMPFARNVARRMTKKYPMEVEDAEQAGYMGLIEAAGRFDFAKHDPAKGSLEQHFKTFAYFRIHGSIVDEYRRNAFISRSAYAKGERASFVSYEAEISCESGTGEDNVVRFELGAPEVATDDVVALRDALEMLDDREYRIVMGQAVGMTGRELSEEFSVDESRISQISIAARQKLQEAMSGE